MKHCKLCGHSRSAHVERAAHINRRCALCGCNSERQTFVQDSFGFRTAISQRSDPSRKE